MNEEKFKPDGIDVVHLKMIAVEAKDLRGNQVLELGKFEPVFINTEFNHKSEAIFHQDTMSEMLEFTETYEYMVDHDIRYMKVSL